MPRARQRSSRLTKMGAYSVEGRCHYCQLLFDLGAKPPHPRCVTLDHVIPKSRGGKNTPENLVAACYFCNKSKGDMTGDEFRAFRRAIRLGKSKREALQAVHQLRTGATLS